MAKASTTEKKVRTRKIRISDQFYIETNKNTHSVQEMARSLELPESIIQDIVDKSNATEVEAKPLTSTRVALDNKPGGVADKYGVKIMTPTASQIADSVKGQKKVGRDDCIHRPKSN